MFILFFTFTISMQNFMCKGYTNLIFGLVHMNSNQFGLSYGSQFNEYCYVKFSSISSMIILLAPKCCGLKLYCKTKRSYAIWYLPWPSFQKWHCFAQILYCISVKKIPFHLLIVVWYWACPKLLSFAICFEKLWGGIQFFVLYPPSPHKMT